MRIPFAPFEPDKSIFNTNVSPNIVNCRPVANGWGPMPDLVAVSEALSSVCMGACFVRTSTGTYKIIAATATGIYELNNTDFTWTDISGTSGPYSATETWTFTRFGDSLLIHQINDPIQVYDINTGGVVADLGGSPPQAKYSCVVGDFIVLGNLSGTGGERTVRWSGYNDMEAWTIGEKGADFQEIPEGGEVLSVFGDRGGFFVIQKDGMQYFPFALETQYTFARTIINPNQGAAAPRSVVNIGGGRFYYLSEDGFFSGADRQPIGAERVDKWFLTQIDNAYFSAVRGTVDPYEKIIWWSYRSFDGNNYLLGYDWQLDRWCRSDMAITDVIPLVSIGMTWDGLDADYSTIDEVTPPFDSRLYMGGRPTLAAFNTDNELCFVAGENLAATLETGFAQPDPVIRTFVNGCRVSSDAPSLSVTAMTKDTHASEPVSSNPSEMNRAGFVPLRVDGRFHKFVLDIAAGVDWSIASDIDFNVVGSGEQ